MPNIIQITAPTVEPITLVQARLQCSIDPDITVWDPLLTMAIAGARASAEHITGRHFAAKGLRVMLDAFPSGHFAVGVAGVTAITAIRYIDAAGALQTIAPTEYDLDPNPYGSSVLMRSGGAWPASNGANSVRVDITAGYPDGAAIAASPYADALSWMLLSIGHAYKNRELVHNGATVNEVMALPGGPAARLLDSSRVWLSV